MTLAAKRFQFREKWFFLLVWPIAFAGEWAFAMSQDWQAYPRSEWVALVDLCLFIPALYFTCFSSALMLKKRLIRVVGIAGLGLLAASFIVPDANHFVIEDLSRIRNALLVIVLIFEGWVFYKVIQAVYCRNADAKSLEREYAMPEWIANLMVLEARMWKAIWALLKRK